MGVAGVAGILGEVETQKALSKRRRRWDRRGWRKVHILGGAVIGSEVSLQGPAVEGLVSRVSDWILGL